MRRGRPERELIGGECTNWACIPTKTLLRPGYTVTERGVITLGELGVEAQPGEVVRSCADWTEQRNHIAGPLGRALLTRLLDLGWLTLDRTTRAVRLTEAGRANLTDRLAVQLP